MRQCSTKGRTMTLKTLLVAGILLSASSAHAILPIQIQTMMTPQEITFQVENIFSAPIGCEGRFFAQTASAPYGIWMNFAIGPVMAGAEGYVTMTAPYAPMGDYFIAVPQIQTACDYVY
jgi:hypothetical protein